MCYCEHCRRNFWDADHMELPRTNNPHDPSRRNYIIWRQDRLFALWLRWDEVIRKTRPGARYIANSGGGALSGLDMKTVGEMAPTLFADRQCRSGRMAPWANGKNGKEYRATLGNKAIGGIFNTGIVAPYRWLNSEKGAAETRLWVVDGIVNGLRPFFNKVSGSVHDKRGLKVIEDLYAWHHKSERYLRNLEPIARVAVVYSQQTAEFYGGPQARAKVEDHTLGVYQALIDARIPFEIVHDGLLDAQHIGRYKLLLLPNIAALSDKQYTQLRDFVGRGGSLVATYETSLYNEWGERRQDFGLADLFGASFQAGPEGPTQNTYFRVEDDARTSLDSMIAIDAVTGKKLWSRTYTGGCDRMAISPDGTVLYVPELEGPAWHVVNAATGDVITTIETNSGSYNTIWSADGSYIYLAGLKSRLLSIADSNTNRVVKTVEPFENVIRPFTVNGRGTLVFVNVNGLLGFEVGDLQTGRKLYHVEVQGYKQGPVKRHGCPSHGIALTPDEREVWLADCANDAIHAFDSTTMPPKQKTTIKARDCVGWVSFSMDGKVAYSSTGEIIDVATKKVVASLRYEKGHEVQSEKVFDLLIEDGKVVRAGNQFDVGKQRKNSPFAGVSLKPAVSTRQSARAR